MRWRCIYIYTSSLTWSMASNSTSSTNSRSPSFALANSASAHPTGAAPAGLSMRVKVKGALQLLSKRYG